MSFHLPLVDSLRKKALGTLRGVLGDHRRYALLDFPNHSNVGDSAIWLGELAALRGLSLPRPCYVSDIETFSPSLLRRRLGTGLILLHGGGNLGDLWARHHAFKEKVVKSFPENPIVQLPQSVEFRSERTLDQARDVFSRHPNLILMARDERSLDRVKKGLGLPAVLCPDMAFCLLPSSRPQDPIREVARLLRTDLEGVEGQWRDSADADGPSDWLREEKKGAIRLAQTLERIIRDHPQLGPLVQPVLSRAWNASARRRLRRGIEFLSVGRVVVTDRLHGHVLCMLLGIPHVVLPDKYGKIQATIDTWTHQSELFLLAESSQASMEGALEQLRHRPKT